MNSHLSPRLIALLVFVFASSALLARSDGQEPQDLDYEAFYEHIERENLIGYRKFFGPQKKKPVVFREIDYPTGDQNPTLYRFDMGPEGSPLLEGCTPVTPADSFSWEKGWGWTTGPADAFAYDGLGSLSTEKWIDYQVLQFETQRRAFERAGKPFDFRWPRRLQTDGSIRSAREDDVETEGLASMYDLYLDEMSLDAVTNPDELIFKVALPNGRYLVSMIIGDLRLPRHGVEVYANGNLVASHVFTGTVPWPGRVAFSVNVVRNNLRIALRANENLFQERTEASAAPPDYNFSQLPYAQGTTQTKWQSFFGKQMNVHGPATQMALAGISIAPYQAPPLELIRQKLHPAPHVDDKIALRGIELFNRGDLAESEISFGRIPDSKMKLKASAYLGLAGHLETEIEEEIQYLDTAIALLRAALKAEPNDLQTEDLLRALHVYRGGLICFAHIHKPSLRPEGGPDLSTISQDSQDRGWRRLKYMGLFTWIGPGEILYSKALARFGRYLTAGDPHRWGPPWHMAEEAFIKLQDLEPGNRFSNYFLYWDTTGWGVKDYTKETEGAPRWAILMHEAFNRMIDQAEWWGLNRLQDDGSIGGGWGDDVEIGIVWQLLNLINPDASEGAFEAARAISEGVWWSGEIDRDVGFYDGISDVEHSAEWTADSLPLMLGIDYGNPIIFERCLKTGKLMRDLWMGRSDRGHLHFKSIMLGSQAIGDYYPGAIDAHIDHPLNGRATSPAFWAWWFSPLDGLDSLFTQWAEAWLEDTMREENGKPAGILPGPIGFPSDKLGGNNAPSWRQGSPKGNAYENPTYSQYPMSIFSLMHKRTGDAKWLAPKAAALTSTDISIEEARSVPDMALGERVEDKYARLEELDIERVLEVIRRTWPSVTSENVTTDRIAIPGLNQILTLITGGNMEMGLDYIPMTFENTSRNVAFMNLASGQKYTKTILYNFNREPEQVGLRLWKLQVGAEHLVKVGIDDNDDDAIDREIKSFAYVHKHRGDSVQVQLPPRKSVVIEVEQTKEGNGMPKRAVDLAMAPEDIEYKDGAIHITIHNIGNMDSGAFTAHVLAGDADDSQLLKTIEIENIEAPNDLEPRRIVRTIPWSLPTNATLDRPATISVRLDPEDTIYEITEHNNVVNRAFPFEMKTYRIPRMWPSLAKDYGLKKGAKFPEGVRRDQVR